MTDHDALESCPFCDGKAQRREYDDRRPYEPFGLVVDHAEDCFLSLNLPCDEDAVDAAWNTRARPTLPASDEAKPVAWLYTSSSGATELWPTRRFDGALHGWIETPLYTASARITGGDKDRENLVARPSDEVREKVALALVNYDCAQTDCPALSSVEEFRFDADRDEYLGRADAALSAITADPVVEALAEAAREVLLDCANSDGRPHIPSGRKLMALGDALAAYRGK